MGKIKMIVTDLDGTFFHNGESIEANHKAVEAARAQGVKVFACTGRCWAMCSETMQHIGMDDWAVTANGASVTQVSTGQAFHPCYVEARYVEPILRYFETLGTYKVNTYCGGMIYTTQELFPAWLDMGDQSSEKAKTKFEVCRDMDEMIEKSKDMCELIRMETGFERTPMPAEVRAYLDTQDQFQLTTSFAGHWDINHRNANKVRGMQYLADKFGFALDEVMAIGDDINDLSMIQAAGLGVAMGNAQKEVLDATQYHTGSSEKAGFANALERWVLD